MTGFLPDEQVDEYEQLTNDDTIGIIWFDDPEEVDAGAKVDVNRLRQALISYEEEIGADEVLVETTELESGVPALLLRPSENSSGAVALAGKVPGEDAPEGETVRTDGGQKSIAADGSSGEKSEHKPVDEWEWITRKCTRCGEKVLQPDHDTAPTFHDCSPEHPQMVPVYGDEAIETDGGLPDTFEDLASDEVECAGCEDIVDSRWIYNGRCPGCRHGPSASADAGATGEPVTDGGELYAVDGETEVESTDQEDALAHLQEIVDHATAINWSEVPGIDAVDAAAFTSRLEDSRRQLEGSA